MYIHCMQVVLFLFARRAHSALYLGTYLYILCYIFDTSLKPPPPVITKVGIMDQTVKLSSLNPKYKEDTSVNKYFG